MHVYELRRCDEYYMQQSHGLYATRELACSQVKNQLLVRDYHGTTIIVAKELGHYANSPSDRVVTRIGVEVTQDNLENYLGGFDFHELEHNGYGVWGVHCVKIINE